MKQRVLVSMDRIHFDDFEKFLYEYLNYHQFGWSCRSNGGMLDYMLELDDDQMIVILLKFPGTEVRKC